MLPGVLWQDQGRRIRAEEHRRPREGTETAPAAERARSLHQAVNYAMNGDNTESECILGSLIQAFQVNYPGGFSGRTSGLNAGIFDEVSLVVSTGDSMIQNVEVQVYGAETSRTRSCRCRRRIAAQMK